MFPLPFGLMKEVTAMEMRIPLLRARPGKGRRRRLAGHPVLWMEETGNGILKVMYGHILKQMEMLRSVNGAVSMEPGISSEQMAAWFLISG